MWHVHFQFHCEMSVVLVTLSVHFDKQPVDVMLPGVGCWWACQHSLALGHVFDATPERFSASSHRQIDTDSETATQSLLELSPKGLPFFAVQILMNSKDEVPR